MKHELQCPECNYEFTISDDYETDNCPNCKGANYYCDYVLEDDTCEELFSGYYWDLN